MEPFCIVIYTEKKNRAKVVDLLMLHITNHVLTSRGRIARNDKRLKDQESKENDSDEESEAAPDIPDIAADSIRDQGFTRPTVLVLLPTRGMCYKFVNTLTSTVGVEIGKEYAERFEAEYGTLPDGANADSTEQRRKQVQKQKGEEWNELFGDDVNQDDDFKMGVALTPRGAPAKGKKKPAKQKSKVALKLYTDFYRSDIIVASPIGLKMLIAPDEDDEAGDADFLSSIEICYVGFSDALFMQNWDHINDILSMLNKQPTKNNDTDFSRVRNYLLDGQAELRRQLIISSRIIDPCLISTFKRFAKSISGSIVTRRRVSPEAAAVTNVMLPLQQVFQCVKTVSMEQKSAARLAYFTKTLLPQMQRQNQKHTLIYVPSYFDFCSLRNVLLKHEVDFVSVTEYSRVSEVSRGRARFVQGRKPLMLYTGRCHFFHRHAIKGARHMIFFGLPEHPEFYADHVNLLQSSEMLDDDGSVAAATSCLALFTKYDAHALERIVGTANSKRMLKSQKTTFMFYS